MVVAMPLNELERLEEGDYRSDSEYTEDNEYMTDNEDEFADEDGHIEQSTCCFVGDGLGVMNG